ncbi:MAG: bifunctional [glutamate--ammonia ligase]-adenylyl-L-tyrosine phosphorylase/[glutamate--ammonia-ligase] adenylyltransferase [Gammaproteobacteria bacterium]|nr:MAG: bifunctional [glutamate--ammonia ligase]-adenylyl-L-tyrosine phosphorylase/[glutamate--ammonia-ligase] adenylyltransferase [Gammaproteobacteria bacterium]
MIPETGGYCSLPQNPVKIGYSMQVTDVQQQLINLPTDIQDIVARYWEQYCAASIEQTLTVPDHPDVLRALVRVWACSDFVAQLCIQQPAMFLDLLDNGDLNLEYRPDDYVYKVHARLNKVKDEEQLMRELRLFRNREMLRIAWRDITGWADINQSLRDTSLLAEVCVDAALYKLYHWMCRQCGIPEDEYGTRQQMVVLGMGKIGAHELNFSSDIDLMFCFPSHGQTRGRRARISNEEFFNELGKRLIRIIEEMTADGFIFRVDMRLRPFGESGPLVNSFTAMEEYYQAHGRDWERYALIKARVIAGDRQQGGQLLQILKPFVYRRYLDFGAFEALRTMKHMIARQIRRKSLENNIKLGSGGIREVEFVGQVFQLIRGGRITELQTGEIQTVLAILGQRGDLPDYVTEELLQAYRFLRRTENRLQQLADQQTHHIPQGNRELLRLTTGMGYADPLAFMMELQRHRQKVHSHFEQVFEAPQTQHAQSDDTDLTALWHGGLDAARSLIALDDVGYEDSESSVDYLKEFRGSLAVRSLSGQGRERLDRLMPLILGAAANSDFPSETLVRVLSLIETIARRSVYLTLLIENPLALSQLVRLCAASLWITDQLASQPALLDELLDPRNLYSPLDYQDLQQELGRMIGRLDEEDLEQQMESLRHFKQRNVLRVAAADVSASLPLMTVSTYLSDIADIVLVQVFDLCWKSMLARYGRPPCGARTCADSGFAIVAYGKLAGKELGYGSDLDLVFIYSGDSEAMSSGKQALPAAVFYARLGQKIIHMLNTLTPSGVLYEVDMRLRPSGASGLLVAQLDSFAEYQKNEAWTWEHQALVRTRVVAGDPGIAAHFRQLRREILCRYREPVELRKQIREMRVRMWEELGSRSKGLFNLKQDPGGIADIEFMVQYCVLRWAVEHPELTAFSDDINLLGALARAGCLKKADAELLSDAYREFRTEVHHLTLQDQPAKVGDDEFRLYRDKVRKIWENLLET